MQKVYLLLRNNQQNGPFSLEEIVKFDLKPYDLIWIEGKSSGWYYPQEIQALHPYLPFVKQTSQPVAQTKPQVSSADFSETKKPKKVFVSMPVNPVQEKAATQTVSEPFNAEGRETNKPSETSYRPIEPELKTTYTKTLEEVEREYIDRTYQKKKKNGATVSKKGAMAACLLVTFAFAAWWAVKSFSGNTNRNVIAPIHTSPVQNEIGTDSVSEPNTMQTVIQPSTKKQKQASIAANKKDAIQLKQDATKKWSKEVVLTNNSSVRNDYEIVTPVKEESKVVVEEKKEEAVAEAPKEQKKKLKEKILDLFKKKPEEKKDEAVKPAENESGERRSARREVNLATQVTIRFEVPNNWMLGIKGAKASLTNRSTETIVKATVEVQYYNEDNDLLQIKTITFSTIGTKKTATVSIPDHSVADHLDYKIISVQGAGEPVAKL